MKPEQTTKIRTTKEIVDGYNDCKMFHTRKWILESDYKAKIKEIREWFINKFDMLPEELKEFDKLTQGDDKQ